MPITGYKSITLGAHSTDTTVSTSTAITPEDGTDMILIQAFTQNVRMTLDGTTPSATVGFQLTAGAIYQIDVGTNTAIKVIEETATASIQWQCFRAIKDTNT